MIFKAKFIGTNGSMGLQKGKIYKIRVEEVSPFFAFLKGYSIIVYMLGWACPYKNMDTFFQNWSEIKETHETL